ncbi:MAG: NAD-binding protein [Dehalococcoidia bacterium]|nr:NAD-binding protein [Dehalococcoidia bacterium]
MYILIVGGGEVGFYLAKALISEGHEVLLIEKDARETRRLTEELGSVVTRGDGCEAAVLEEAGAGRADMLAAVTGDDEDNLVACQVAKYRFNVPRTIARLKNPEYEPLFSKLGVDVTVSGTELILSHIEREVPTHPLIPILKLDKGGLEIVELKVAAEAIAVGRRLRDLPTPPDSLVFMIIDKTKGPQIPTGDTVVKAGDEVVAVIKQGSEKALRAAFTGS